MPIKNRLADMHQELTAWRRDFHENPELCYEEHRTAALVATRLRETGCDEVVENFGRTGVVGIIRGRTDTKGRVIGLRADMDALPVEEITGAPHASKTPGKMHACGHDGHTTMLLGAARYLAETRNFDGTVVLIFQPAEEGGAGADAMIRDGLISRWNVQEIYGMHNWPGMPVGQFSIKSGGFFAATATFEFVINGRGGHAAQPHRTIDPTVTASQLVLALQTIVSRNADPVDSFVVSVTSLQTETQAFNIIPQVVTVRGTVRTLSHAAQELAAARIKAIGEGMALTSGARIDLEWKLGYPLMVNDEELTGYARKVAEEVSGREVLPAQATFGGEDFAYFAQNVPSAYILCGNGDTAGLHNPAYDFDDDAILPGASWYVGMIESRMPMA